MCYHPAELLDPRMWAALQLRLSGAFCLNDVCLFVPQGERSFSEDEEQKLQTALALEKQALHLVLETTSFLLEQVGIGQHCLLECLLRKCLTRQCMVLYIQ